MIPNFMNIESAKTTFY